MLRLLYTDSSALDKIIYYGTYRASLSIKQTSERAYAQLLYMAARHPHHVPDDLFQIVEDYFDGDDPCDRLGECMNARDIDDDILTEFISFCEDYDEDSIIEWYRVYLAQEVLGVELGEIPYAIRIGHQYADLSKGNIPVSCSKSMVFHFRDSIRTEYDRVKCAMYLAIRSLAGNSVAITTSKAIQWRMMGAKNEEELKQVLRDKKLKTIYDKWSTKRQYRNILNDLVSSGLILEMPYNRRTCVTASVLDEKEFVLLVSERIRHIHQTRRNAEAAEKRKHLKDLFKKEINTS